MVKTDRITIVMSIEEVNESLRQTIVAKYPDLAETTMEFDAKRLMASITEIEINVEISKQTSEL